MEKIKLLKSSSVNIIFIKKKKQFFKFQPNRTDVCKSIYTWKKERKEKKNRFREVKWQRLVTLRVAARSEARFFRGESRATIRPVEIRKWERNREGIAAGVIKIARTAEREKRARGSPTVNSSAAQPRAIINRARPFASRWFISSFHWFTWIEKFSPNFRLFLEVKRPFIRVRSHEFTNHTEIFYFGQNFNV